MLVGWLEFNVPFLHKYGYVVDEGISVEHGLVSDGQTDTDT